MKNVALSLLLSNLVILCGIFLYQYGYHSKLGMVDTDIEIVVAHYDEDLTWIDRANDLRYTIYSKSSNPPKGTTHLPNLGRESQTFLYHIVSNYNSLADWTVFTQAAAPTFGFKANNHNSGHLCSGVTWDNYIKSNKEGWYEVQTVATRYPEMWHSDRFEMMFMMPTSDGGVCPSEGESGWSMWWSEEDHPLLKKQKTDEDFVEPVEFYNRYVVADASDKTYESFTLNYANGGRFAVSRERILMRPLSYYMDLLNELSKNINPIEGYYMETMWYDVFHPERLQAEYGTVCSVPDVPTIDITNHASMFDKSLSGYNDYLVETYGSIEAAPRDLEVSSPYIVSPAIPDLAPKNPDDTATAETSPPTRSKPPKGKGRFSTGSPPLADIISSRSPSPTTGKKGTPSPPPNALTNMMSPSPIPNMSSDIITRDSNAIEPLTAPPTLSPTTMSPTTISPTIAPTIAPTNRPTAVPTSKPTITPTVPPTQDPTLKPTSSPTTVPTPQPTSNPTSTPTKEPSFNPTLPPSVSASSAPSSKPTTVPTDFPTCIPTATLSSLPSAIPTATLSSLPSAMPSSEITTVSEEYVCRGCKKDVYVGRYSLCVEDIELNNKKDCAIIGGPGECTFERNTTVSVDQCKELCLKETGCTYFASAKNGLCYLYLVSECKFEKGQTGVTLYKVNNGS